MQLDKPVKFGVVMDGKEKDVENGAVLWVHPYPMQ